MGKGVAVVTVEMEALTRAADGGFVVCVSEMGGNFGCPTLIGEDLVIPGVANLKRDETASSWLMCRYTAPCGMRVDVFPW